MQAKRQGKKRQTFEPNTILKRLSVVRDGKNKNIEDHNVREASLRQSRMSTNQNTVPRCLSVVRDGKNKNIEYHNNVRELTST